MTLQEINDSYKDKSKAKTSPTVSTRQDMEELRIAHITHANRKPIDFGKIHEKVTATLEVAQTISVKTTGIRKHFKKAAIALDSLIICGIS